MFSQTLEGHQPRIVRIFTNLHLQVPPIFRIKLPGRQWFHPNSSPPILSLRPPQGLERYGEQLKGQILQFYCSAFPFVLTLIITTFQNYSTSTSSQKISVMEPFWVNGGSHSKFQIYEKMKMICNQIWQISINRYQKRLHYQLICMSNKSLMDSNHCQNCTSNHQ